MEVEHPAYHADVQRGKPTKAPTGEQIDPETGTFKTDDEAGATAAMDALTSTYGVEYNDDGTIASTGGAQPTAAANSETTTDVSEYEVLDGESTINELEETLATGAYDDELDTLEAAEADGKDREGAYDAIDARRETISGGGGQ